LKLKSKVYFTVGVKMWVSVPHAGDPLTHGAKGALHHLRLDGTATDGRYFTSSIAVCIELECRDGCSLMLKDMQNVHHGSQRLLDCHAKGDIMCNSIKSAMRASWHSAMSPGWGGYD